MVVSESIWSWRVKDSLSHLLEILYELSGELMINSQGSS